MVDGIPEPQLIEFGGLRCALARAGTGTPSVVLIAGLGLDIRLWRAVFPRVADVTTVCTIDHPAIRLGDPVPTDVVGPSRWVDAWLGLLATAGLTAPYVLVAHSTYGRFARIFAARHRTATAGLGLVDTANEDMVERLREELTADGYAAFFASWDNPFIEELHGLVRAEQPRPDLPVVVLTRGEPDERFVPTPDLPVERWEVIYHELQRELAARFPAGMHRVVEGSRHLIPRDQPDAVVQAIRAVVDAARRDSDT